MSSSTKFQRYTVNYDRPMRLMLLRSFWRAVPLADYTHYVQLPEAW